MKNVRIGVGDVGDHEARFSNGKMNVVQDRSGVNPLIDATRF